MKKWIVMMLALALVLSMVGCAASGKPADDTAENIDTQPEQTEDKEKAEAPAEEPKASEPVEDKPAEDIAEQAEEPAEDAEAEAPVEEETEVTGPDLASICELLQAAGMPEMIELDQILMLDYCGIEQADVKQAVVAICADSLRTDELWLVEAIDEEAAQRIVELAQFRLEMKGEESITYSPEQYEVVQQAKLLQEGTFVALLVSPEVDALTVLYEQLIAE